MVDSAKDKDYECYQCIRPYMSRTFQQHIWVHTEDKLYKFDLCDRSFTDKGDFYGYIINLSGLTDSNKCANIFTGQSDLIMATLIGERTKVTICEICQ